MLVVTGADYTLHAAAAGRTLAIWENDGSGAGISDLLAALGVDIGRNECWIVRCAGCAGDMDGVLVLVI